jgi:cbb3-type cytochrome oxidase subunit 3
MAQNKTNRIREYASTIGILILLAGVLGFYYLKYVPERRGEFNQAAFLELNQIEYALQFQNKAYHDALQNIIQHDQIGSRPFDRIRQRLTLGKQPPALLLDVG